MAAGVIMSLSFEADTWGKGNNYFYGQFTGTQKRDLTYLNWKANKKEGTNPEDTLS